MAVDEFGDWRGSPKLANTVQSCRRWDGFPDELFLFVKHFSNDDLKGCAYSTMFPANAMR
jgi:hypothetical protein